METLRNYKLNKLKQSFWRMFGKSVEEKFLKMKEKKNMTKLTLSQIVDLVDPVPTIHASPQNSLNKMHVRSNQNL